MLLRVVETLVKRLLCIGEFRETRCRRGEGLGSPAQAATWTVYGGIGVAEWLSTLPWAVLACLTLAAGWRLHDRASAETYIRWLRGFMWVMVPLLLVQFARAMSSRLP